jgi:hypothetical protein
MTKQLPSLIIILLLCVIAARADQEGGPVSYTMTTPDGQYIFAMDATGDATGREHLSVPQFIYAQSGMYKNDGSTTPLWTVGWVGYAMPVDEHTVIRQGRWPRSEDPDSEALSFFRDGALVKTYSVGDLIYFRQFLPHTVSHYEWAKKRAVPVKLGIVSTLDLAAGFPEVVDAQTVSIETLEGAVYKFDTATGEIVSSTLPYPQLTRAALAVFAAALAIAGFVIFMRRHSKMRL